MLPFGNLTWDCSRVGSKHAYSVPLYGYISGGLEGAGIRTLDTGMQWREELSILFCHFKWLHLRVPHVGRKGCL